MSTPTDRELVERARGGDGAAIGELFSRYWRAARAAAFGVAGEFASAEDAAAEAFRDALGGLDSLRDSDRFGSWLRTIVLRKAQLHIRRRSGEDILPDDLADSGERHDEAFERAELGAFIQRAMQLLPDPLREAMALVYVEGYDADATARLLDIPDGTLRRRLHDGRARLCGIVEEILQRSTRMRDERGRRIQECKNLIESGEIYQAIRQSLSLRPVPGELIDLMVRQAASRSGSAADDEERRASIRDTVRSFTGTSSRASNADHPVGSIAAAIRKMLPEFRDWSLDAGEAAARFLTFTGEHRDRLRTVLPPGFAEGRPGAYVRATRALLHAPEGEPAQNIVQLVRDRPTGEAFRAAGQNLRVSDVLDLTWMVASRLELRAVQDILERLIAALIPGENVEFSTYDEPRYRSALQVHASGVPSRLAYGGVLNEWPGRARDVDAAHLRIFLEPWATVRSGQVVEFELLRQTTD